MNTKKTRQYYDESTEADRCKEKYSDYTRFSGGINHGTIRYKNDTYRVKPAAFKEMSYCTNIKWMVEALEVLAFEKIRSGDYETYFEKISEKKGDDSIVRKLLSKEQK